MAMVRRGQVVALGQRLGWHLSPGQESEKEGPLHAEGCKRRPARSSENTPEKWGGPQDPSLPLPLPPAPLRLKRRKGSALRRAALVPETTGLGRGLHPLPAGPSETWEPRLRRVSQQ